MFIVTILMLFTLEVLVSLVLVEVIIRYIKKAGISF